MLKENSLSNVQMFAGSRVQAKKTFLGLQTTMKCNNLNQLEGVTAVQRLMGRLRNFNFQKRNDNWTFCSLRGAVKGCNTYSETAFAPQSKTFPARSPFTSANCLSSQPRESRDSITLWKHFKAIPFSFCFTCKTDGKHWIYRPTFLTQPWLSQSQGHIQASPLCSWPLMDQPITAVRVFRTKKKLSWILTESVMSARI